MRISLFMILGLSIAQNVLGATNSQLGVAASNTYNRPDNPALETPSSQRVRIPMTFKAWSDVETRDQNGNMRRTRIAGKPVSQVLRARIERANDFFLGDYRIKTTPVRWLKRSNQYQIKLELFKRLGEDDTIEESLGSVTLTGVLEKQDDGLYVLNGSARRIFRDRTGDPILDLDAGMHAPAERPAAISRR